MEKLAPAIFKLRWLIIVLVVCLTAFLGWQITTIQINSDVISALPDDDADAVLFKSIGEEFGGNKIGMLLLETDHVFDNDVLQQIGILTDSIAELDGISSVTSLTNVLDIRGDELGFEVGQLVDTWELPYDDDYLLSLKERVLSNNRYRGTFVSADATTAVIMFTLFGDSDMQAVGHAIRGKVEQLNPPYNIHYAGLPMLVTSIADLIAADLILLIPIAFIVIALVLLISFRSFRGVLLPLLTAALAIVWTIGGMALLGFKMTMVTNNIPILLLAVGSAYTIHVINKINQVSEMNYRKALMVALKYIFLPVLLAALTTAVGFTSFVFEAYLSIIQDFGLFTAIGTLFSALLALFFAPALLYVISPGNKKKVEASLGERKSILTDRFLSPLRHLLFDHPKYTLVTWSLLILLSLFGMTRIQRSVDVKEYFRPGDPTRHAEDLMLEKFGGSKPIFILFKGDVMDPVLLNAMHKTRNFIEQHADIQNSQSIDDLIADVYEALGEGNRIPDERETVEQLWFFLDGNPAVLQMVNEDLDEAVIISKYSGQGDEKKIAFREELEQFINNELEGDFEVLLTGMPFIDLKMNQSLLTSQVRSLLIAIIALILVVGIIFRSFGSGIYATAPIIATILVLFGLMGYTGIPLNIATVLVASIALGIGIDYSIHVISYFNFALKNGRSLKEALGDTIMISGKAIVINVVSVTAGFLVLVFSEMMPLVYFGILMAISMIGSGLAALTLLPVILVLVKRKKLTLNNAK